LTEPCLIGDAGHRWPRICHETFIFGFYIAAIKPSPSKRQKRHERSDENRGESARGRRGSSNHPFTPKVATVSDRIYRVLFVCTGNSARSIMAEGLLNHLGHGRFTAHSAGSHPKGAVHPLALKALEHHKLPTDGFRSKGWSEFTGPDAPALDFVFTVCDTAAGEECPVWSGQPVTAQWGVPDPAAFEGSDEEKLKLFIETALVLRRRIELMLALPFDKLDELSLQRAMRDIGTQ
jgi:arsenate reductase (thioredoxin)